MLATLGDTKESLEFACIVTGSRLQVFQPKQYFSFRGRGMRRRIIRHENMLPGYLIVRGDVAPVLACRLTRMKNIGQLRGLEVARLWEQERQSFEAAADEIRNNQKLRKEHEYGAGERVWCAKGLFRGKPFIVQAQRDREVRLKSHEPLLFGTDEIILDAHFLSREEIPEDAL